MRRNAAPGRHTAPQQRAKGKEVVIPLVVWSEPPRVQVSSLHVLYLPSCEPSQNSSVTKADNQTQGQEEANTHLCVFVGTTDGVVVYWRFEQERVAQVNLLVFPVDSEPVVGIVSGTDEWGQSTLVSATRSGALARWQLPNGACAEANATLAKELAPLEGLEMLCNRRFAVVVSEEARLMVLDTWKMQLLYCVDTAQEQIRQSVAVGELPASHTKTPTSTRRLVKAASHSGSGGSSSDNNGVKQATGSSTENARGPSASPILSGSPSSASEASNGNAVASFSSTGASDTTATQEVGYATQRWDALVLSLGAEGLVKCFLWAQPRGSTSSGSAFDVNSSGGGSANTPWGFRWVQRSCWVVSWADEADDITCSQSTSLKDGDNMNPQAALMGSIKSSYFPLAVHLSPDSSLVLLIWKAKWAILEREWLCPLVPQGENQTSSASFSDSRANLRVGTCRIPPTELVREISSTLDGGELDFKDPSTQVKMSNGNVCWENGEFLEDGRVALWTNTGHVFWFTTGGMPAGKFFIFTKDHDQLVPRCDSKDLYTVNKAVYVTSMNQCKCCSSVTTHHGRHQQKRGRPALGTLAGRCPHAGFTSCARSGASLPTEALRFVHVCRRGMLGLWTIPRARPASPSHVRHDKGSLVVSRVQSGQESRFHSLDDGFEAAVMDAEKVSDEHAVRKELSVSHLILGREDALASSMYEASRPTGMPRKQHRHRSELEDLPSSAAGNNNAGLGTGNAAAAMASSVLASALAPVTGRGTHTPRELERAGRESATSLGARMEDLASRYLLDVPILARGFSDGTVSIGLFSHEHTPFDDDDAGKEAEVHIPCHAGQVSAIAHCFWGSHEPSSSLTNTATTHDTNKTLHRSVPTPEELHFATENNPFYRSRFPEPAIKRETGGRHLDIHGAHMSSLPDSEVKSLTHGNDAVVSISFMVFSGGKDGVLRVIALTLYRATNMTLQCEAVTTQRFRNHRGPIQQISISPIKTDDSIWASRYPDRLVATVGVDNRVVVYAPQYAQHPSDRNASVHVSPSTRSVEWECVLELSQHAESICDLDWHLDRGLLYVDCDDRMVYVWNTDTGILERTLPEALLYGGGNASGKAALNPGAASDHFPVESSTLTIGEATAQLHQLSVLSSAEQIKSNWTSYYHALSRIGTDVKAPPEEVSSALSPYATGSMELHMLSLLLSWGATPAIDGSCTKLLGIETPQALYSCALRASDSDALTIPVPWAMSTSATSTVAPAFVRNWQHSSALSANVALGIVSLCMSLMEYTHPTSDDGDGGIGALVGVLMSKEDFQVLWSQLVTQHSIVLPECVPRFREPALEELAAFGFNSCEYTQLAARSLLSGVIKRLSADERTTLSAEYSAKLHWEMVRLEMEMGGSFSGPGGSSASGGNSAASSSGSHHSSSNSTANLQSGSNSGPGAIPFSTAVNRLGSLVLLVSMMGTCFPGEISPAGAREVCDILVFLLRAPEPFVASVSAELLTKGLMLFRPHLVDLASLISQLLFIDMREKRRSNADRDADAFMETTGGGSKAAMSLLVEVGACETAFVLSLLQQELVRHDRPAGFHEGVLLYLTELVNTHYLLMCRHLPAFVDTIMACLDPTKPDRRRRCLSLSTRYLHNLVQRFPMVDFHKETQRLALGTVEAVIVIYDLRTATKWRVLVGHTSAVSALRFRQDGQVLVSYAAREASVRWWNSGSAGLFGGMLKMHQSCLKEHKLEALSAGGHGSAPASSGGASAGLKQIIQTCRFHFLARKENRPGSPAGSTTGSRGSSDEAPKHILRLTREDASQVQFLL